jgi:hypothetical protein
MAYVDKILSMDQLLAAWQNRNQREAQSAMQQKMAEQQMTAQELENKKAEMELSLLNSPYNIQREHWAGSGNANTPGTDKYISDNQKMQKLAMLTGHDMPSQGIHGWGGGGNEIAQPSEAETRQANAVADIAEEQARMAQQQRQGVGDADKYLMAQKLAEIQTGKARGNTYDDMIGGLRDQSKSRWSDINAGDNRISDTKSMMSGMQNEIDKTKANTGGNVEKQRTEELRGMKLKKYTSQTSDNVAASREFAKAPAAIQQQILDMDENNAMKIFDIASKVPAGKKIDWNRIIKDFK